MVTLAVLERPVTEVVAGCEKHFAAVIGVEAAGRGRCRSAVAVCFVAASQVVGSIRSCAWSRASA